MKLFLWKHRNIIGILVFALIIKCLYINQISSNPFFSRPVVDAMEYHKIASSLAEGTYKMETPFYQPPLYPFFLGALYKVTGSNFLWIRVFQALTGCLTILLIYLLALRLFNSNVAIIASLSGSLYGPMLFFEAELLAPVLIIVLNISAVLMLYKLTDFPSRSKALISGFLIGLSAITSPVILPFALILLLLLYFLLKPQIGSRLSTSIILTLYLTGLSIPILATFSANYFFGKDTLLISYNGGLNFYLGTGPNFREKVAIRPGLEWNSLLTEPKREGKIKKSEHSTYFIQKSLKIIETNPLNYFENLFIKLGDFIKGDEIIRNQEIYPYRNHSPILSMLLWKKGLAFPFGLLLPLAIMGLFFHIKNQKKNSLIIVFMIASHISVLLLFFITSRYRMNIIPFLIIEAAFGIYMIFNLLKERKWRQGIYTLIAIGFLILLSNRGIGSMEEDFRADSYYNLGVYYNREGESEMAQKMLQKALLKDPQLVIAHGVLGDMEIKKENYANAINHYQKILDKYPENTNALRSTGLTYFTLGDLQNSRKYLLKALSINKEDQIALKYLEKIENSSSNIDGDIESQLKKALKADPQNAKIMSDLGMFYIINKDFMTAEKILLKAVSIKPDFYQGWNNLGIALYNMGKNTEAKKAFLKAVEIEPNYSKARENLGRIKE